MTTKVARQQKFDKRKRSFQATWFDRCKWPHNDAGYDSAIAFCFACCKAAKGGKVRASFREMQKKNFLFDQPSYRICRNVQDAYQDQLETVLEIYKDDFLKLGLEVLLKPLCKDVCNELAPNFSVHDAIKILSKLSVSETESIAFSGVWKVLDQILVLSAMNVSFREVFFCTKADENLLTYKHDPRTIERFDDFTCSQRTS